VKLGENRAAHIARHAICSLKQFEKTLNCRWHADDLDIFPRNRALEPSFYGLFPDSDKRRSAVLFVMTLAALCKLLGLVLAFALFIVAEHTVVVGAAYAVRIALVFVVKAARRDLPWYWPTRGGVTLFCALLGRISTAILVDFADFHCAAPVRSWRHSVAVRTRLALALPLRRRRHVQRALSGRTLSPGIPEQCYRHQQRHRRVC
jgi:hypothetical protein